MWNCYGGQDIPTTTTSTTKDCQKLQRVQHVAFASLHYPLGSQKQDEFFEPKEPILQGNSRPRVPRTARGSTQERGHTGSLLKLYGPTKAIIWLPWTTLRWRRGHLEFPEHLGHLCMGLNLQVTPSLSQVRSLDLRSLKNAATWVPVQVKVSALEKTKHIIVVVIRKSHNISMQKYYNLIVKMTKVGCLIPLEVTLTLKKKHDKYHPTQTHQKNLERTWTWDSYQKLFEGRLKSSDDFITLKKYFLFYTNTHELPIKSSIDTFRWRVESYEARMKNEELRRQHKDTWVDAHTQERSH